MSKGIRKAKAPQLFTVGELISELCRWPDHAEVTFRCRSQQLELRFNRVGSHSKRQVEIELDPTPKSASAKAA